MDTFSKISSIISCLPSASSIGDLVDKLGLRIIYVFDIKDFGYTIDDCIFINKNLDQDTIFFIIAHEIGHCLCHADQKNVYSYRMRNNLKKEREANLFAYLLLDNYNMNDYIPASIIYDLEDLLEEHKKKQQMKGDIYA